MGVSPGYGRWSPDGKTIAFHANPGGQGDVFAVPADGGKARNLTDHPSTDVFASFSRDGRWVYFSSTRSGEPTIWKVPASGGDAVQVSGVFGLLALESPDGADLYYVESTTTDRPGPLLRLSLKDGEVVRIVENGVPTSFEVVDGGIYYIERVPGEARVTYFDLATRQATMIASRLGNVGPVGPVITVSRDGRSILFSRVDSSVDDLMLVENFR